MSALKEALMTARQTHVTDMEKYLHGYRLTTAEIYYGMPDYPHILQTFVWQELDLVPTFPVLCKFLTFWKQHIDGPLKKVRIAHCSIIHPSDLKYCGHELALQ